MPKVSVIIPIYNSEKFLCRCIDSVLMQTFTDFEVILVDDGSIDNSSKICDDYTSVDSRVKVIHKRNEGASIARNTGLNVANGEYITFIDSDDYVSSTYLADLYSDISTNDDLDLVIHGIIRVTENKQTTLSTNISRTYNLTTELALLWRDINIFRFCGSCSKLFRRLILNKHSIRFSNDIICAEDYDFLLRYIANCNNIKVSQHENYYYIHNSNSISTRIYDYQIELSGLQRLDEAYFMILNLATQKRPILSQYYKLITYYTHRVLISIYKRNDCKRSNRVKMLQNIPSKYILLYRRYYDAPTLALKLIKLLFGYKLFSLLDLIMYIRLCK